MFPLDERVRIAARRSGLGLAALAALTFGLIVLGAVVRAKGAGLACPDWPLCFGRAVPAFDAKIALEWGHRVLAGFVSLGLLATSAYVLRFPELRRLTRGPLSLAWLLLGVQVALGGFTVLLGLAPWTVTAHLVVGNAFCATLLWLSRDMIEAGRVRVRERDALEPSVAFAVALFAVLLVGQIVLGGMVSSNLAGLACSAFPTCDGDSIAPTLSGLVGIHVLHRLNACALALACIGLVWLTRGQAPRGEAERRRGPGIAGWLARICLHIVLLQIVVGAVNVLGQLPSDVTALHSALAAGLVISTALLVREAWLAQAAAARAASEPDRALELAS
ncbi:MAG: COX15/CtaA family protein [Myxococcota bacterium]